MRLVDQFIQDGDRLFRWRSYFPLLLAPVLLLGLLSTPSPFETPEGEMAWQVLSILVALAGLALRAWSVGTAPSGTSERSTVSPRASELRTSGVYSMVRHPLYVANGLMALGLAMFPAVWYLPVVLVLATLLYYERIAAREESFLHERFGNAFETWGVARTGVDPHDRRLHAGDGTDVVEKVLRHEFHGLLVIAAGAFVLDAAQMSWRSRGWAVHDAWLWFFAVSAVLFVIFLVIKKGTRLLEG